MQHHTRSILLGSTSHYLIQVLSHFLFLSIRLLLTSFSLLLSFAYLQRRLDFASLFDDDLEISCSLNTSNVRFDMQRCSVPVMVARRRLKRPPKRSAHLAKHRAHVSLAEAGIDRVAAKVDHDVAVMRDEMQRVAERRGEDGTLGITEAGEGEGEGEGEEGGGEGYGDGAEGEGFLGKV